MLDCSHAPCAPCKGACVRDGVAVADVESAMGLREYQVETCHRLRNVVGEIVIVGTVGK